MAHTDETVMKRTTEKPKRQMMDGEQAAEPKPGEVNSREKMMRPRGAHLNTSASGKRNLREMEGMTEKSRTGEQREGERKEEVKKRGKERGTDVSGDGGMPGEKRARRGSGDEKGQDVEESQVIKKSRGQEDIKNVRVWTASYSSTVDLTGGDKNIKQGTHRREKDEVDKVQNLNIHRELDRKQCGEERDQRDESTDGDQYVLWVQCSKPECGKWRRLSNDVDPSVLPDDWACQNNTDPSFSSCSAPEEKCCVSEQEMFFCSLVPGSLVWARQSGHPWWPAMIERDPNTEEYLEFRTESDLTPYKCHVTYFGEPVTRAWVICSRVRDYADLSEDQLLNDVHTGLKDAIDMAKKALKLSLKERLMNFGFRSRYLSDRESSEDSDIAEMLEVFLGKDGYDCNDEDSGSKKHRPAGRKQKERKREGKRNRRGKENDKMCGKGEKKKTVRKEGKEEGKEKKCLMSSFSLPKKKKQPKSDQIVPQSALEPSPEMTFDLDIHSEGEEMERKSKREKHEAEKKERRAGKRREDEDEGDEEYNDALGTEEEQNRFSPMLCGEE